MTLHRLFVRNFQSLKEVDVELGAFTVIVGPSNSGKSALIRAAKTLISNARGTAFITQGTKQARIEAVVDGGLVRLFRGTDNVYDIGPATQIGTPTSFTKLAGGVPEQVTKALGIDPVKDSSLHFAGQFDRPYLIDTPGAQVARILGELTNVTTILEAAREANRRKAQFNADLKTREADLADLRLRVEQHQSLPARLTAIAEAEAAVAEAEVHRAAIASIAQDLLGLIQYQAVLDQPLPPTPAVPTDEITQLISERAGLVALLASLTRAAQDHNAAGYAVQLASDNEAGSKHAWDELLRSFGTCPTCGAEQAHFHPERVK